MIAATRGLDDDEVSVLHQSPPVKRVANIGQFFNRVVRHPNPTSANQTKRRRDDEADDVFEIVTPKRKKEDETGTRSEQPIEIEDDEDAQITLQHAIERLAQDEGSNSREGVDAGDEAVDIMNLEIEDFMTDAQLRKHLRKLNLEQAKKDASKLDERTSIPLYKSNNPEFRCGTGLDVELGDGTFLRIKEVLRDGHGRVFLTGQKLVRQNYLGLMMSKRRNEVVLVRKVPLSAVETNPWDFFDEVPIGDVCRNRKVIFTNQSFPNISIREDNGAFPVPMQDVEHGPLFCRWSCTTFVNERKKSVEHILERVHHDKADNTVRRTSEDGIIKPSRIRQSEVRDGWRDFGTTLGGSHLEKQRTSDFGGSVHTSTVRSYTFGDAFCGAGGTSRGAVDAGLKLLWGFDFNDEAIESYKRNFSLRGVDCRGESVDIFISDHLLKLVDFDGVRVDVLHISPPCQPFSPAHTIPSPERDEANQAALPSVWQLVELLKPRVVTIEETEGLLSRHIEWFHLLINTFTCLGYSVRWKVAQCHSYGVPQTRKRLLIVAAGPGELLPPFPEPTHSADDPNLKPLATINSTISSIPLNAVDHDQTVSFDGGITRFPFDGNIQAKTVTTNAGQGNYHPSGKRPYTLRELARLQTFPLYHSFAGGKGITEKRRQVGNAVPPLLAKAVFRSIVKSLKESDAKEMNEKQA